MGVSSSFEHSLKLSIIDREIVTLLSKKCLCSFKRFVSTCSNNPLGIIFDGAKLATVDFDSIGEGLF